jgi:hypothetical protein
MYRSEGNANSDPIGISDGERLKVGAGILRSYFPCHSDAPMHTYMRARRVQLETGARSTTDGFDWIPCFSDDPG